MRYFYASEKPMADGWGDNGYVQGSIFTIIR